MPRKNEKDLIDVPDEIKERMDIRLIERLDDAVEYFFPKKGD